ncbi:helix-turn-helix transcriptional regulator [Galbibacter sp. EGI 63066]|nr:helix-turn-helix transcriptional regulator [Galbibacter sp. EGI 63066]
MVSLFDVKKRTFICCSGSFETVLGYTPSKLIDGGWDFWIDKIDSREKSCVKKRITEFLYTLNSDSATIYLRYHLRSLSGKWYYLKHVMEKYSVCNKTLTFNYIYDFTENESINRCLKGKNYKNHSFFLQELNVSSRECEVLKLISNGLSSKQIADKLCISYHTAVSHRKHLIEKFKVLNTAQLVKMASEIIRL